MNHELGGSAISVEGRGGKVERSKGHGTPL